MFNIGELIKNTGKYVNNLEVSEIVELLKMLSDMYYNSGETLVSDNVYDEIIDILKKKDPNNKYFEQVGAPIKGTKELVKLPFEMGSLSKIKPSDQFENELKKWVKKYKGPYFLSDKLDGVSAQIYKDFKSNIFMYTRGDGIEGQNISHLLKFVVSKKALKSIPNGMSIRGELIINKIDFKTIEDKMKNARNAVAGLVNSKTVNENVAKITKFVAYSILNPREYYKDQIEFLTNNFFDIVVNKSVKNLTEDLLKDYLTERVKKSEYEIDGIVIFDDSIIYKHAGGYPDHSFAFKMLMDDQIAETTIVKVLWKPSKDGYLKPRIEIKPVELAGTTVTFATAFNARYIVDNNIGPGAIIKIIRSGYVIPYIQEVIKGAKDGPQMPNFPYSWNETKVDVVLDENGNDKGDETFKEGTQIIKVEVLVHFFSKIGVKYLSKGILTKLVENDYDTVAKILKADKDDLSKIDGLGIKMIDKIYDEIDRAFDEIELEEFMGASNILGRGLSATKFKDVVDKYPNLIKEFKKYDKDEIVEKILEVPGFKEISAAKFAENFDDFLKFYKTISKIKDISRFEKKEKKQINDDAIFKDKTFVFTGFRNKDYEKFITDNGGKVSGTVSGNTYMLIYADDADINSSKFVKAEEKGTKILKKTDFEKNYIKK
jgi:DNA ligase (NAD+)